MGGSKDSSKDGGAGAARRSKHVGDVLVRVEYTVHAHVFCDQNRHVHHKWPPTCVQFCIHQEHTPFFTRGDGVAMQPVI